MSSWNVKFVDGIELHQYMDTVYWVSSNGKVYSDYKKSWLNTAEHTWDHHIRYMLGKTHMSAHKLVYLTWVGEIPQGLQINHKDGNGMNNEYTNLYLGTQKDNIRDAINAGNRIGKCDSKSLVVLELSSNRILKFCPIQNFFKYDDYARSRFVAGCDSSARFTHRKWFTKKYKLIEFGFPKDVTTKGDECNPVSPSLSRTEVHSHE